MEVQGQRSHEKQCQFQGGEPWESVQPHESMPKQWEFGGTWFPGGRVRDSVGVMIKELGRALNFSKGTGGWDRDGPLG